MTFQVPNAWTFGMPTGLLHDQVDSPKAPKTSPVDGKNLSTPLVLDRIQLPNYWHHKKINYENWRTGQPVQKEAERVLFTPAGNSNLLPSIALVDSTLSVASLGSTMSLNDPRDGSISAPLTGFESLTIGTPIGHPWTDSPASPTLPSAGKRNLGKGEHFSDHLYHEPIKTLSKSVKSPAGLIDQPGQSSMSSSAQDGWQPGPEPIQPFTGLFGQPSGSHQAATLMPSPVGQAADLAPPTPPIDPPLAGEVEAGPRYNTFQSCSTTHYVCLSILSQALDSALMPPPPNPQPLRQKDFPIEDWGQLAFDGMHNQPRPDSPRPARQSRG
jgi:hypothetical protein